MGSVDFSASLSFDAIVSRCWDSIIWQAKYVSKLKESLQKLTTSLQELMFIKNDVKTRVEDAEQQPFMKRLEQVQGWILRVETIETEVHEVVKDSNQEIEKLCCGGFCSKNYISSYRYGRKVAKMLVQVDVLKSKGVFQEVAQRLPRASVDERPIEPTVGMDLMLDKVWSYIKEDQVGIIGIYGMGGVGKTTLLTQINNSFLHTHNDFNLVIWVLVSKDLKLDSIQDQIGEKIGFSNDAWKQKAQHQKFLDIYRVLSKKKFVLLLDDVWKRVEITEVGVPIPDNQNKSKIIFTTRSKDVCGEMDAHKKIKVEFLAWDQAWNLFQNKVGEETLLLDPDIPELAKTVAKECGGLPLAIITIGRAMACKKTPQEWKHAIQVLKDSASEFSGMGDKVFRLLKFSYDNLPSEKIKSCFLYCSLFPEGFLIFKDQLLYFWMCEGILDKIGNVEEAQNECYHILSILLNACLLEEHDKSRVKMHDISRDMALWLACESEKTNKCFLVQAGANLIEVPNVDKWKNVKRVSLMSNHIKNLDAPPESRNLLTLFLGKNHLNKIVKSFFDFMPTLQVLDLSNNKDLTQLPCGVSNLVTLQYLNLAGTGIRELPIELKNLVSLKFLDLESMNNLNFVPLHMISSFSSLKVLKMLDCGYFKEKAMLEVLQCLKQLHLLTLNLRTTSCFEELFCYHNLVTCIQKLSLQVSNETRFLDISSLANMKHLDYLRIKMCLSLEHLKVDWKAPSLNDRHSMTINQSRFISLQCVVVYGCDKLKDLAWLSFSPNLSSLTVILCSGMEKIIDSERLGGVANVVKEMNPFAKLAELHLSYVPLLQSIYESTLLFPCLKLVDILNCPSLKKLPLNSRSAQGCNIIIEGKEDW